MRKIKNVLRLKFQLHLSNRQIARSCALARSTVAEYVRRAQRAGLTWPLPEGWDDRTIQHRLFPPTGTSPPDSRPLPDFATVHEERCRHKHVTLMLLWDEYKQDVNEDLLTHHQLRLGDEHHHPQQHERAMYVKTQLRGWKMPTV